MVSVAVDGVSTSLRRLESVPRIAASLTLVLMLGLFSLALDPDGSLGTDTGGKVATVDAMIERGDWNPSIGYWAEDLDLEGTVHPFFSTRRTDQGWINVTSLPMILLTRSLIGGFGEWAMLAFPIFGSLLACLAAGELGRHFGAPSWHLGFMAAATCSPIVVYGIDFWEHSMGLALMLWGAVGLVRSLENGRPNVVWAAGSGLAFGLAATMRQEALIFGFVAGLVCLFGGPTSWVARRIVRSAAMAAAALVPLIVNQLLEAAFYGETLRSDRAVGVVQAAGGVGIVQRLQEGILITASPINLVHPLSMAMAALVAGSLVWLGFSLISGTDPKRPVTLVGLAVLLIFLRVVTFGPTFVPGMMAAVPAAGLGVAALVRYRRFEVAVLALAPLPIVWATQYAGAAEAQWGGRYILLSGLLLTVFGVVRVARSQPRVAMGFLAANLAMSTLGLAMVITRTHAFGEGNRTAASIEGPVVFSDSFIAREAAPLGRDMQWLAAGSDSERAVAATVLSAIDTDGFTLLARPEEGTPPFDGYEISEQRPNVTYGLFELTRTEYVRSDR